MSEIDELIEKWCPNGVKFVELGSVCQVLVGGEPPNDYIKSKTPNNEYKYPIYSNGLGERAIWGYSKTYRVNKRCVTFSSIGTLGYAQLRITPFTPIIRLKVLIV